MNEAKEEKTKKSHWHMVKIDDSAFRLLRQFRNEMKRAGQHASYSDALREAFLMKEREKRHYVPSKPLIKIQERLKVEP